MPRENRAPDDPRTKVYNAKAWQRTRAAVFARDGHRCVVCGAHGNVGDHWPTPLLDLIAQGGDPFDPANVRTLCRTCSGHADGQRAHPVREKKPNRFLTTVLKR